MVLLGETDDNQECMAIVDKASKISTETFTMNLVVVFTNLL